MTPLLPLGRLIGISASMSNWKVLPTQIMLGLMVPLLTLPDVKCSPPTFAGWPPPAKSGD